MDRKKKIRLIQFFFFIAGFIMIIGTYLSKRSVDKEEIISSNLQEEISKKIKEKKTSDKNKFYNVRYSGLDLEGNRYTIISKEAINSDLNPEIVIMNGVSATFYFKDNTRLNVTSEKGEYNNKTLDIRFDKNIEALYQNGKLSAGKAEFSNSNSYLTVSEKVKVVDPKGSIFADKLVFDLNTKKLNIISNAENVIRSNVKIK